MAVDADSSTRQVSLSTAVGAELEPLDIDLDTNDASAEFPCPAEDPPIKTPMSAQRWAIILGLAAIVALSGLCGWLATRAYHAHRAAEQRSLFVEVGRQGAINLTTIDWQHGDSDVRRILDSATGTFYDDFAKRSEPFMDVVRKAQSSSVGTVTGVGLESETGSEAQVLVAVTIETSNSAAPQQDPRAWRMRILVEKVGDDAKIANVEFVP